MSITTFSISAFCQALLFGVILGHATFPCIAADGESTNMVAESASAVARFWSSDPVAPGQTVMVVGSGFAVVDSVVVGAGAEQPQLAKIVQQSDGCLKFLLPENCSAGVFQYRFLDHESRELLAGQLNGAQLWWLQGDLGTSASPGGSLRLFGKNFTQADAVSYVRLSGSMGDVLVAEATAYAATVQLPEAMPVGKYAVQIGYESSGGRVWSQPLEIEVKLPKPWSQQVFNVKDFHAYGDGKKDDTRAITNALRAADGAGGGVVYLPRGRYRLSGTLHIPRFTTLRGEAESLVSLAWDAFETPPFALLQGTNSFALEHLTILTRNHTHIIVGDLGKVAGAGNIHLNQLRVRASRYRGRLSSDDVDALYRRSLKLPGSSRGDAIRLGGENVTITGCDIYGSGRCFFLSGLRNGRVEGNQFYTGRRGWYSLSGSDGLIFSDNKITGADLQSSGGGINCLDGSAYSQNVYFANNSLKLMHGWDREAMTSDASGGVYFGSVASVSGAQIVLSGEARWGSRD